MGYRLPPDSSYKIKKEKEKRGRRTWYDLNVFFITLGSQVISTQITRKTASISFFPFQTLLNRKENNILYLYSYHHYNSYFLFEELRRSWKAWVGKTVPVEKLFFYIDARELYEILRHSFLAFQKISVCPVIHTCLLLRYRLHLSYFLVVTISGCLWIHGFLPNRSYCSHVVCYSLKQYLYLKKIALVNVNTNGMWDRLYREGKT